MVNLECITFLASKLEHFENGTQICHDNKYIVTLRLLKLQEIYKLFKLPFSKCFLNSFNLAPTSNIREVMKFQNVDDQSFETDVDFSFCQTLPHYF